MKLVANNEIGLLVDANKIDKLTTIDAIDNEITRIKLTDYMPIKRDTDNGVDTVVEPEEYLAYLQSRRDELIRLEALQKNNDEQIKAPKPDLNVDSPERSKNADLLLELKRKDDVISRLLSVAKKLKSEQNVGFYEGDLPQENKNGSIAINSSLRILLQQFAGDRHISAMGNCAIARGILGDVKAQEFITDLYDETTYKSFLDALGDTK